MPPEGAFFVEQITGTIPACAQGRKLPSQTPNTRPRDGSRFAAKPIDAVYYVIINSETEGRSSFPLKFFNKNERSPGLIMIQLLIEKESDLYNPYDPSQMRINEGVYRYLKSYCSALEYQKHKHDTLQIITDSQIDEEKFQRALHEAVEKDIAEFDRQIARNNRRVIWESIIGVVLCALGIMLAAYLDELLLTIISLFGTMAVRDALTINTTINHDIKNLKKLLSPISDIKLEVVRSKSAS